MGKLKSLSFFSGAMGLDLGLEQEGITILTACENNKAAQKTIKKNKPSIPLIADISDYSAESILNLAGLSRKEELDLIVGGPPCQAFSTAGARKAFNDKRGNVFLKFVDTIIELEPKYFVIENVRGLLSAPLNHTPHSNRGSDWVPSSEQLAGSALNYILTLLEGADYQISFNLYNAANYGVPQVRERVIIVGTRNGLKLPYLKPTHSDNKYFNLPEWRTVKDAFMGLDPSNHNFISFPEKRLKYYRLLKAGQYWKHLPVELQKEALGKAYFSGGGKTGFLRRLDWDKPSCTLVTSPTMPATDICHPELNRPLSIEEYKRIQQFPDDWEIQGSLVDQYKQIGNAVPVGLGRAVGRLLMAAERGDLESPPLNFPFSRYKETDEVNWKRNYKNRINELK